MSKKTPQHFLTLEQTQELTGWLEKASPISEKEALQIICLFDQGHSIQFLAKTYSLAPDMVVVITCGYLWKGATERKRRHTKERNAKLKRKTNPATLNQHRVLFHVLRHVLGHSAQPEAA